MTTQADPGFARPRASRRGARSAPLQRVLATLAGLPRAEQLQGWRVYRLLRRAACNATLLDVPESVLQACEAAARQSFRHRLAVALAVKLAHRATVEALHAAARTERHARVRRALLDEAFFLLRRELRVRLGLRTAYAEPELLLQRTPAQRAVQGWLLVCDGSARPRGCGAGVVLFDEAGELRATVALPLPACTPVAVELAAVRIGLQLLSAFGVSEARLHTDCLAVLRAFEGALHARYREQAEDLGRRAAALERLHVRLVPRTQTRLADALAAGRQHPDSMTGSSR